MRQLYGTPAEPVPAPDDSEWPDDDEFRREAEDEA